MLNVRILLFAVLCFQLTSFSDGARILAVFPFPAPSHYFLGNALMKGLAEAGHDITLIAPFSEKNPPKNGTWREIMLDNVMEDMKNFFGNNTMSKREETNPLLTVLFINTMGSYVTEGTFRNAEVQKLIHSGETFDAVIMTQFLNDGMKALATHFKGHLILFSNAPTNTMFNHLVGDPLLPSYHPQILLTYPSQMSFFERVKNTLFSISLTLYFHLMLYPKQNELIKKYIPNPPDITDVLYNASLILVNSHPSISPVQPSVPCMIEIGGFHVNPPKKLPDDLQVFLDSAKEGVIYFSMGSNLKSKNFPPEQRDAFLNAFSKRKEQILWKWEDDTLPGQPTNVKLGKWLPQQDILAHPNVKVFITHGGMLSTIETIYHGKPVLAIPIAGDQHANAKSAERAGYGIVLSYKDITEERLSALLDEIISNPKYTENVKKRSSIMKDRQVKPIDNAVYWVEYVIRHNGARHLRVPYLDHLSWYQFYLFDVLSFIFGVVLVTTLVFIKLVSYLYKKRSEKRKLKTQ